ncbi:MAG: extracellular solute-binding protein [Alphaproteobacteria bacterium]|nr:extracellular solute-binding protein [Alphaproteobacteria bacterium]
MRRFTVWILILAAIGAGALYWFTRPLPVLTVTTWPGSYGHAQRAALIEPYRDVGRVNIRANEWEGDLGRISRAVTSHVYEGDVIDFELPKAIEACQKGLLEPFDASTLPAGIDGAPASSDFVKGAIGPCWVGSVVYSQAVLFAKDRFGASPPATLADFFDLQKYPGPRALKEGAKLNLEMALLADGVAPDDVYRTLESEAGIARAFAKLSTLKPGLVFWRAAGEPAQMIASGRAVFSTVLNGDIFDARAQDLGVIWDRQLYELDVFAVPKGNPKKDMAMDFIRYATGARPLARMANRISYGPARRSALALVGRNPEFDIPMRPFLPTAPGNFATAFAVDDGWWLTHGAPLEARFRAWENAAD